MTIRTDAIDAGAHAEPRRSNRRAVLGRVAALALCLGLGLGGAIATPDAAAAQSGRALQGCNGCLSINQVAAQVRAKFGSRGYKVGRIRLRRGAPTASGLWYEVELLHASGRSQLVYWSLTGGQLR